MVKGAAMAGALLGAGLFLFCGYVGGFDRCVTQQSNELCFTIANAPVVAIAEVWTDGPVRPQAKGADCTGTFLRPWNTRNFVTAGIFAYGLFGAIAAGLARMGFGDR